MDIVKQRRKRLMAWILAVVLCVGMWQGSVYAEGDEPAVEPEVVETLGDIETTMNPEVEQENSVMPVADGYTVGVYLYNGEETVNLSQDAVLRIRENTVKLDETQAKYMLEGINLLPEDVQYINGDYVHNVIEWCGYSGGKGAKLESLNISGNCDVAATLGKSVVVYQPWDNGPVSYPQMSLSGEGASFRIELPDSEDTKDGIFDGWLLESKEENTQSERHNGLYTKSFNELKNFETFLVFSGVYSTNISNADNYTLYPGTTYTLDKSLTIQNEYTYSSGISFVIEGGGEVEGDVVLGIPVIFVN